MPGPAAPRRRTVDAVIRVVLVAILAVVGAACAVCARADDPPIQLDPFAGATHGHAGCPEVAPPLLDAAQARVEAHARVERGLRCSMDGTCAPGGSYRHDPALNAAVTTAVAEDPRFADTAVWVTTSRHWITLQGCVRTHAQRRQLVLLVRRQPGVERVFDELRELRGPPAADRRRPRQPAPVREKL